MQETASATERYQVLRRIGAGGMGVVYEAEDRERGQKVALKTIANPNADKVFLLKREFRGLADLSHPNLVALYDLVVDTESCFFTMELLDGVDLLAYLWHRGSSEHDIAHAATTTSGAARRAAAGAVTFTPAAGDAATISADAIASPCQIDRLRAVLPQLARGLHALHTAGKIHRDVKPSNVQVTSDGRAVLLDFGLVAELERRHGGDGMIAGTISYMAPEQCAGDVPLTPAADWYALGVVLFHALTARLPFEGAPARVLLEKQTKPAPRASRFASDIPADLDELCAELLEREPQDRPSGPALLRRCGVGEADSGRLSMQSLSRDGGFSGRDAELAQLASALEPLVRRRAAVAVVRAPSGMGKTSLVTRFFERVRATHDDVLLLRGRCLEREDVPYKAIDHLIDELSDWWRGLPPKEAQSILPRDACLLPTLFPVLDRVPAIADAPRTRTIADPQARRTHAFDALRETLQRLGDRRTVVLFLDDFQWVDRDTTALLADLMRAPDPPPLLLVLASRADDTTVVDLVRRMDVEPTFVDLGPLPEEAALGLAISQLGEANAEVARQLVREADGSPLFLIELTRYLHNRTLEDVAGKGLDAMLAERIEELGADARQLAELVAIAGEPLTRRVLGAASGVANAELSRQLQVLRAQRVVRSSGSRADDTIEPYHARIRVAVAAGVPGERRAKHHRAIATALSGKGTSEQLARHWYGAGDLDHAAGHARRAGDDARAKLDFDLCARWYAIALEGAQWSEPERRELRTQLGDALADAGRPRDAADQFLAAAEGADSATTLELRRRASGALLQSGYVTEGLAMTRQVLAAVGLAMARTPMRSLISMLLRRAWMRVRGLGYRARPLPEISQAELTRVDVCESTSFGLLLVDTFASMDFGTRFLHEALRLGETWRVSRALALEADFLAATAKRSRAMRLLERLVDMTKTLTEPPAASQLTTTRAMVDFFLHNKFRAAEAQFAEAIADYRAVVGRAGFALDTVSMFHCWSLYYLGEIADLSRRVPAMAEASLRNGNRHTAVTLRCAFPVAWLARLAPEYIEAEMDAALASWTTPDGAYQLLHMVALCARIDLALYTGRPDAVTARIAAEWPMIRRGLHDRAPIQAMLVRASFARHALALAAAAPEGSRARAAALADVRRHMRPLRSPAMPLMVPIVQMFDGLAAEVVGDDASAEAAYRTAITGLDACDAHLFAHALRDRLGRLVGGDEGATLCAGTRAWLTREGVRDPERILAMLLPGGMHAAPAAPAAPEGTN